MKNPCKLSIVVPCYNETPVLAETSRRLLLLLEQLIAERLCTADSFVLYVNDGSADGTWQQIEALHDTHPQLCGLNLAHNVGHQRALVAGLQLAARHSDAVVSIDADLQDDVQAIVEMVKSYLNGTDIVFGVRQSRQSDTWFKRTTAQGFYKVMKCLGVQTIYNHADFRLMSRRAVEALLEYRERNLFLRGIVAQMGFQTSCVYYDRSERFAGESKYPLSKMLGLAFEGITSFSVKPVHLVLYLGLFFLLVALGILLWVLYCYFFGHVEPGWSSLMLSMWFCSGCVLTGLGVIGEYIGKIYVEVKDRPRFHVEQVIGLDDVSDNR